MPNIDVEAFRQRMPQVPTAEQLQIQAPQIRLPSFENLPAIQSFTPQIEEAGRLRMESGLGGLRSGYAQEEEDLQTKLAAAGTYDAGDYAKLTQRMFQHRGSQEKQLIADIQAETLAQQVQEMQRTGQITEERARAELDMRFQSAMQAGDWENAAAVHNAQMRLEQANMAQRGIELEMKIEELGYKAQYDKYMAELDAYRTETERRGMLTEEERTKIAHQEEIVRECVASHGQDNESVRNCINTRVAALLDSDSGVGGGTAGGGGGEARGYTPPSEEIEIGGMTETPPAGYEGNYIPRRMVGSGGRTDYIRVK